MESSTTGNLAKSPQALADRTADKVQAGILGANETVKDAGNTLSSKASSAHESAVPLIRKAGGRPQSTAQQIFDVASNIAEQAREMVSSAADSVVGFTKRSDIAMDFVPFVRRQSLQTPA